MGAGKTTLGHRLAERLDRPFVDVDELVAAEAGRPIAALFAERGEAEFRALEAAATVAELESPTPAVVALGGGGVETEAVRRALAERAVTVWLDVDADTAWERARGTERPLARDEEDFRARHARRHPLYAAVADAVARDDDDAVLAAAGVHVETGALERLADLVPGDAPAALVADARVSGVHGAAAQLALGARLATTHELPVGEAAKTLDACRALWDELRLGRDGVLVALGGGCTTDAAGFAAATYLRGIDWVPVPTTLVGQVDAAIGGKTALNLPAGKNLLGAFHWPARVVVDPALLETLPAEERRAGLSEIVKTGLLAGEPLWELPEPELVRRCAAYKAAVCLRDPLAAVERAILNLGHTFAHALEAAAGYEEVSHGHAVALGLLGALRLSGLDEEPVRRLLDPRPVRVDAERAWEALRRDKKAAGGRVRLVLLERPGVPVWPAEVPEDDVRRALGELIAG
ncbi:MAG TPA: bifunctional shikimate kinase/3-dehydroquinate synthase [Gaiellaceae bacterium]|nr:bifunctional shikimate kinase/3-dehydroquinate synthase [Gaiellaceae bacterium]